MVIIFFSGNLHKAGEIAQILQHCEVRLYSDFVEKFSVEENGKTFAQNAKIKLLALKDRLDGLDMAQFGGRRVVLMAEDSGICVEGLGGEPGIYSARFFSRNLSWGMQFRTCENFGERADSSLVLSPKFSQIQKPHRHYFDCDSAFAESTTTQTQNAESALDSTIPQNLTRKIQNPRISHEVRKSFCYFWLKPKVESSLPLNFNQPSDAESALDSTIPQNLTRKALNHRILKAFATFGFRQK